MKTYPLHSISLEQAKQLQFKVIDAVTRNFQGEEVLSLGDLGVVKGLNKPRCTVKVEKVFADTFDAPAALLVRGSGTGAIRWALTACLKPGDAILVHTSPIYTTTQVTIDAMGLKPIRADFNDLEQLKAVCAQHKDEIRGALVQLTRQKPEDRYDYKAVIAAIKAALPGIPVVTDDNYAALKVDAIGCQAGADLSTFSCFKILGPEGVGAVIGSKELICAGCEKKLPYTGDRAVRQTSWGRVAAPLYYEDAVRRAILDFKFKGRMGGLPCFGSLTARCAAEEFGGEFDAITWVPVSRKRLRKRGFDQARYLAGSLCVEWHVEPQETLRKILDNPPQSGLEDADARRANVLGAYEAVHPERIAGKRFLLVDDICTTGSTLGEAARVLRQAGAADVLGLTLAVTREE